ncbi:hypothetical protein E2C01_083234 [Portunus trituberculatus]|uniref:Uncharacterized protein n=1 Tax=Portunus trituberculatus TaxID=210409 RepID=A0A5B7J795_PORTR|nr:hypothetical protein [Portunus trituberculatus]
MPSGGRGGVTAALGTAEEARRGAGAGPGRAGEAEGGGVRSHKLSLLHAVRHPLPPSIRLACRGRGVGARGGRWPFNSGCGLPRPTRRPLTPPPPALTLSWLSPPLSAHPGHPWGRSTLRRHPGAAGPPTPYGRKSQGGRDAAALAPPAPRPAQTQWHPAGPQQSPVATLRPHPGSHRPRGCLGLVPWDVGVRAALLRQA